MQFVEYDVAQAFEEAFGVRRGDEQGELFRRGQEHVRRRGLLALALVGRRVAGAGLHRHRQAHLANRLAEISLDVDGQRLERRDVERVDAAARLARLAFRPLGEVGQRRQETGQGLARAGRRDQQHRSAGLHSRQKVELVRARRPAALREPFDERLRQAGGGHVMIEGCKVAHAARGSAAAATRQAQYANKRGSNGNADARGRS